MRHFMEMVKLHTKRDSIDEATLLKSLQWTQWRRAAIATNPAVHRTALDFIERMTTVGVFNEKFMLEQLNPLATNTIRLLSFV